MHGGHAAELVRAAELQISLRPPESLVDHFYFAPSFFPTINSTCFVDFHLNTDALLNFEWGS